ncbi:unnamed protein product [Arctogadus glacialis]
MTAGPLMAALRASRASGSGSPPSSSGNGTQVIPGEGGSWSWLCKDQRQDPVLTCAPALGGRGHREVPLPRTANPAAVAVGDSPASPTPLRDFEIDSWAADDS